MFENKPKFGPEHYNAGEIIIRQGDEPERFYIITRGQVDVLVEPVDSLEEVIDKLGPGDYFGEVGMIRRSRRMATVRAKTAVDLMAMDYQTFINWIDSSPEIAAEIDSVVEKWLLKAKEMPELLVVEDLPEVTPNDTQPALATSTDAAQEETTELFKKGETILHQGELADKFYIIIDGFVTVTHTTPNNETQTIAHLTSGDYFGEVGLLDGGARIATVVALSDVKVLCFDRDTFKTWMQKSPSSQKELKREAKRRRKDTGMLSLPDE